MNTYPVSEPEMQIISSLSEDATIRFSLASLLFGLGASIFINAVFYTELTPAGILATKYVAPIIVGFALLFVIGGVWSIVSRRNAWEQIKKESSPIPTVVAQPEN